MEYDDAIKKRLRRVEGQVRGIIKMMDEEKSCKDIVSQMSAVRSAVDKAIAYIVALNLEKCVLDEKDYAIDQSKAVQEAVELLIKSR